MATPTYEEIMGSSSSPSYEEIMRGSVADEGDDRASDASDDAAQTSYLQRRASARAGGKPDVNGNYPDTTTIPFLPIPGTTPEFQKAHGLLAGVADTAGGLVNFVDSPQGLPLLMVPGLGAGVQGAVGAGFAAQGASDAPQAVRNIAQGIREGDAYKATMGAGELTLDAGMLHGGVSTARRIFRSRAPEPAPILAPAPEPVPSDLHGMTLSATPEAPAEPAPPEPSAAPEPIIGTSNLTAPVEKNVNDLLMLSNGDHASAIAKADQYGMTDAATELRRRVALQSAVEPTPSGQGQSPIAGDERTLEEGAAAPAMPQPAVRLNSGSILTGESHPAILQKQLEDALASGAGLPEKGQRGYLMPDGTFTANLLDVARAANPDLAQGPKRILRSATDVPSYEQITNQGEPAPAASLPMGPGKMTVGELPPQNTTGIKRIVVDTERLRRGEPEIPTHRDAANDEDSVRAAEDVAYQDPSAGPALVTRINGGDAKISRQDAAMLLVERQRIINERTQWEQRAGDENSDPSEKTLANQRLQGIEEQLTAVDNASRKAGAEWSGIGRMYQRMILEDFSLDALQRKARAAKGESLTSDERETLKQQADAYQKQKEKADALQKSLDEANAKSQADADLVHAHEQTIKEMQAQESARPKFGKAVLDQAQKIVDRLKVNADASRIKLRALLSQMNTGADPTAIVHVANILAHKVGEFGLKKAEAFAEMVDEYGPKIEPFLEKAWKQVKKIIGAESAPDEVKKIVKAGVRKRKGPTPVDAAGRLKADATAGDELSPKTVRDVWAAYVKEHGKPGVEGVNEAAKATHEIVKQSYPNATEQQVREAFSRYGKVKFPSREADKVMVAEHSRITQLQLSIDRLKAGLDPLHTGLQRDKATQAIREKQAELNELLKRKTGPPSPEALAGRNEARKTALRNSIADLEKQLRTGIKPVDTSTPLPFDADVERLTAIRDAMKDKLNEIERVEPLHPAQKALDAAMVARERAGQALDDISTGRIDPSRMPREALTQLEEDVRLETDAMKRAAYEMRRDAKPKTDEDARAEAAKIKSLDESIERYRQNTATLARGEQVPEAGKMHGPDSPAVAARKEVLESRKSMYETAKKAGIPEPTPAERYNKSRMAQIEREAKKAQARIDANDYGPRPVRQPKELFAETQDALAKLAEKRLEIKKGEEQYRQKNRSGSQKFWDGFVGIQRAMKLSSDVLIAKLSLAAIAREALTPLEEGVGGFFSKAFPLLAERAPREGGFSLKAEAIAKAAMFTDGMKDAWQNLKFKESQLSLLHGEKLRPDPKWWDYMGFLHAALKAPVKRAEFARSLSKRVEWAIKEGRDTNDPLVMKELAQEAYVDGERAIFMQDNAIADFFNHSMSMMAKSKEYPIAGPGLARLGRFLLPIVKVPTNIVGEVATGIHGLPTGLVRVAHAYAKGIESLPPEHADAIMRQLKKGWIGGAFLLTGYLGWKSIGGFYHGPDHRSKDDVQADQYRIGNVDLPSWFSHSTAAMLLNIGATIARVEKEKSGQETKGFSGGLLAAGQGLFRKLPFVPALTNIADAAHDEGGFKKYINSMLVGSTEPALLQHLAKVEDTPGQFPRNILTPANRRTPKTTAQAFEAGVPILRRNVPFSRGYTPPKESPQPRRIFQSAPAAAGPANRLFRTQP